MSDKVVITCALNGVLTDPNRHPVPYTPEEMAQSTKDAYDAGASVVHMHLRDQQMGRMPVWDPELGQEAVARIKDLCPDIIINFTTGIIGDDISGPTGLLEAVQPDMAAMNSGSLNYLKVRSNGDWAWPPLLFDNPVDKIEKYLAVMKEHGIHPECECFDTGIVRSLSLFKKNGLLDGPFTASLVQGVESGMPARTDLLPILVDELPDDTTWQSIVIGRREVWDVHRKTAEMGGNLRVGVEDTFYLPNGDKVDGNGPLIEQMATLAREVGREPATPDEARQILFDE